MNHPVTPDGRYFVVRGRLWRRRDPRIDIDAADALVKSLMAARRALRGVSRDDAAAAALHARVDEIKRALGERGAPWWSDGAPDYNRRLARLTPYADWFHAHGGSAPPAGDEGPVDDRDPSDGRT